MDTAPHTPELSICISTLDVLGETCRPCIEAIREHTREPYEIAILDNGGAPQGYTRPTNSAIRAASAPYIVIANDDTRVCEDWWPPLRAVLDDGYLVAFSKEARGQDWHNGLFNAWFFAMRRETIDRVEWREGKLFDEQYVIHNADTALFDRITRRIPHDKHRGVAQDSYVLHQMGRSVFGHAPVREWADWMIIADTSLKDDRYARYHSTDEMPWTDPDSIS